MLATTHKMRKRDVPMENTNRVNMTAVKNDHNVVPKQDLMAPVSPEMQKLLEAYGIERHMMAYYNREEPNRIYVNAYGQLHFIDLSMINPTNGSVVQNLALKACELAQNDPIVRNDLETELNKVIQRVLSKLAEKHSGKDAPLTTDSSKCVNTSTWQMLTDTEREELQRERRKRNAYKTSLCRSFRENNICPYGDECVFAHGEKELRLPPQAHPKYKTQLCNKFSVWNYCPYGARCQYIHQRVNEMSKIGTDMLQIKKNTGRNSEKNLQRPSRCFIIKHMNKSIESTNSSVALGNHSSFDEHGGFYSSLTNTDFNGDEKRGQSIKGSGLILHPDYSISYDDTESHLNTEIGTNNIILNQFREHFNNIYHKKTVN
uniref:C3H1-type domain-containing protein n=1 Tax=Wuchereria bancrofti TaxID=6293 RepID=A0A1I8ECZ8_WUCBA